MSAEIDDLAVKTEKLGIEPCYDTNWSDMPPDIKLQCIERMELKERLNLRCTSKIERSLVDSQKLAFVEAIIKINLIKSSITLESEGKLLSTVFEFPRKQNYKRAIPLVEYLLKHGSFQSLDIISSPQITMTNYFQENSPLSTCMLHVPSSGKSDLLFYLNNLKDSPVAIRLNAHNADDFPFDELLTIPQVIKVPFLLIEQLNRSDSAIKVAQMYMKNDVEIGCTFQAMTGKRGTMKEFVTKFGGRIISKRDDEVKIRTGNPGKHIALTMMSFPFMPEDFVSLAVVNAHA